MNSPSVRLGDVEKDIANPNIREALLHGDVRKGDAIHAMQSKHRMIVVVSTLIHSSVL